MQFISARQRQAVMAKFHSGRRALGGYLRNRGQEIRKQWGSSVEGKENRRALGVQAVGVGGVYGLWKNFDRQNALQRRARELWYTAGGPNDKVIRAAMKQPRFWQRGSKSRALVTFDTSGDARQRRLIHEMGGVLRQGARGRLLQRGLAGGLIALPVVGVPYIFEPRYRRWTKGIRDTAGAKGITARQELRSRVKPYLKKKGTQMGLGVLGGTAVMAGLQRMAPYSRGFL